MRSIVDPRPARSSQADVRRRHPSLAVLLVAVLLQACVAPATDRVSSSPDAHPAASARPSTASGVSPDRPAFAPGALLRARTTIALTTDWAIRPGQALYVIAREDGRYRVQHWGDLDTGLRPDTVIGSVDAAVLEAGAEDVNDHGDTFEIISESTDLVAVRTALQDAGIDYDSADPTFLPSMQVPLDVEAARKVFKLIDALEDSDEVQNVYSNFDVSDQVLEEVNA